MSVELTFYGGLREIGGTKILLKTSRGAVFLDFGKSFDLEGKYFDEWNPPFYIPSLIQIGALPDMEGLYRMKPGRPVDGVIISHPHQDHVGHVPLLSPEIPIYAGADTAELIRIRNETYNHNWQNDYSQTLWKTFKSGDVVEVEDTDISFMPVSVDHSVPGSYAFIVEADGQKIAYTGDIRMHGRHPEKSEAFLRVLKETAIDALICEGTHAVPEGGDPEAKLVEQVSYALSRKLGDQAPPPGRVQVAVDTEADVAAALEEIVKAAEGLVVVEIPPIDLERLYSVWRAARSAGRIFVIPSRLAQIILQASKRIPDLELPDVKGTGLYLSQLRMPRDKRGPTDPEDAEELMDGRRSWEQRLAVQWVLEGGQVFGLPIGREAIRQHPDAFVICSPQALGILPELCYDGQPCPLTFVQSKTGPFNLEMALSSDRLLQWLALFGCREYYHVHVSGHAPTGDISRIVEAATPDVLVPIHTRWPEAFGQWHDRVLSGVQLGAAVVLG